MQWFGGEKKKKKKKKTARYCSGEELYEMRMIYVVFLFLGRVFLDALRREGGLRVDILQFLVSLLWDSVG
jgi:hypothetical protein